MNDGAASTVGIVVAVVYALVFVGVYVWTSAALAAVFAKLGGQPWRAWVPVLNIVEVFERGGLPGWQVVFLVIPVVNIYGIVLLGQALHRINRQFGRGGGMTVLGLVALPIWASVLGWSSAQPTFDRAPQAVRTEGGPLAGEPVLAAPPAPYDRYETPAAGAVRSVLAAQPLPPGVSPWAPVPSAGPEPAPAVPAPELPVVLPAVLPAVPPAPPMPPVPPVPEPATASLAEQMTFVPPPAPPAPEPDPVAFVPPPAPPAPEPIVVTPPPAAPAPAPAPEPVVVPAAEDDEDDLEGTIVVQHDVFEPWSLVLDDGRTMALAGPVVLVGRRPTTDDPGVRALAITDPGRTLSKQHARLELVDGGWQVTDLGSTNGVFVVGADGVERRAEAHVPVPVVGRLVLGTVGARIEPTEAP